MRTLKKALCMVLAVVMILGLGAFGVAADFTDAKSISSDYTEAVDLLNAIGVIKGEGDGSSFNPEGELTRAQGAAIITRLMGYDEKTLPQSCTFTDVAADHWAIGAIGYCESEKIIGGMGDGTFHPNETLTGYAFTKMLLTAAGYDAASEGLTGDSWEVNTQKLAKSLGLDDGVTLSSKAVQRQEASQLGFNALTLNEVRYTGGTDITVGDTTIKQGGTIVYLGSFMADNFGLKAKNDGTKGVQGFDTTKTLITGVVTANSSNTVANKKDGTTTLTAVLDGDATGSTYATDTGIDLLGHYVQLYVTGKGTAKEKVLTVTDLSKVVEVPTAGLTTAAATDEAFGASTTDVSVTATQLGTVGTYTKNTSATAGTYILVGTKIVAKIGTDYIDITGDKVASITETAGSEAIVLAGASTLAHNATTDVVNPYDGIAKDDYVVVTKIGAIYTLTKAETVEGKITKNANGKLTVNGTAYAKNDTSTTGNKTGVTSDAADFTNEFTLYLDGEGGYFLLKIKGEAAVDTSLVYVVAQYDKTEEIKGDAYTSNGSAKKFYVQGIDMDGNEVNYQVWKDNDHDIGVATKGADSDTGIAVGLYTVAVKNDTDSANTAAGKCDYATLTAVTDASDGTADSSAVTVSSVSKTAASIAGSNVKYYQNDTQKIIYVSGSKTTLKTSVVTGKTAINQANTVVYGEKTNKTAADVNFAVKYIIVPAAAPTATTGNGLIFVKETGASTTTAPYTKADSTTGTAYVHSVYIDGEKKDIIMDGTSADATGNPEDALDGVFEYTVDSTTGLYTLTSYTASLVKTGKITNNYNGLISTNVSGVTDVDVNNAKLINAVAANDANYSKIATSIATLSTHETVTIILNSDNEATFVYITAYTA